MTDIIDNEYQEDETLPAVVGQGTGVATITMPQASTALDLSTPEALERAVQQVMNGITYKDRVMTLAISTMRPGAIIDQDGKPYVGEHECERIMSLMGGGSIVIVQAPTFAPDEDGNFGFMTTVEIRHPVLGCFQGWGSAHSTDKFLGTNKGASKRKLGQVERHNLAQHALTRAKGSALRNMLGLTGLEWEDLAKWGFHAETAGASVDYRKGGEGGCETTTRRKSTMTPIGNKFYKTCCERWTKEGIPYAQLSAYAKEQCNYTGAKILSAPDDVLSAVLLAVQEGIIDGMIPKE